jgi:hypothetical protein
LPGIRDAELQKAFALESYALSTLEMLTKQVVEMSMELEAVVYKTSEDWLGSAIDISQIALEMGYVIEESHRKEISERASRTLIDILHPNDGYIYQSIVEMPQFYQRDIALVCMTIEEWAIIHGHYG